jgi:hypothetical protein
VSRSLPHSLPAGKIPTVREFWESARTHILSGTQKESTLGDYEGYISMILRGFKGSGKGACPSKLLSRRVDRFDD